MIENETGLGFDIRITMKCERYQYKRILSEQTAEIPFLFEPSTFRFPSEPLPLHPSTSERGLQNI
jgi:hypothetical protein